MGSEMCIRDRHLREHLNADVFVFDYRGYGKSEGEPYEAGVLQDSEAALNFLCEKVSKQPDEIIILGHSIGGGPAVHLASKKGAKLLILQRTFSSLIDAASGQYPWVPVRYLMKNRYPSQEKIKDFDGPLFQSHGNRDNVINIELARDLYATAPTKSKYFFEVDGMGHYDRLPGEYWTKLKSFVESLPE